MRESVHEEYRRQGEQHWWFRARRAIFAAFLDAHAPLAENARILDVGPGSGVNLPVLAPRGRVTVLDLSAESLRDCRARGADHVLRGDAAAPPLRPGSFDLVCALDVLEHLADEAASLAAWHRVLRPGGHLLLSVPALRVLWGRQDVLSGHHRRYRRTELRRHLANAGFEVQRVTYFNSALLPPILGVRLAMRPFLRRSVARGHSDLAVPGFGLNTALERVFGAERHWLVKRDLPIGVSLLAWARRAEAP